ALLLACMGAFGLWRVPAAPSPLVPNVKLRILQPNLPQDAKFRPEAGEAILSRYLALSDRATGPRTLGLQDVTHLIWPESAFPFLLGRSPAALARIQAALPAQTTLITGAARAGDALPGESRAPIYNSIQVVAKRDGIIASADKHHLVPFGEYLPAIFDRLLRSVGLKEFVAVPGGFASATELKSLRIPGLPLASPLICYEAVFAGSVIPRGARPGLLLNVTNDGWFGRTTGPHQHFAQARLRAIEEGVPLVRAANTGISGVVDGHGRILARLDLGSEDVLDSALPRSLASTVYSRIGDGIFLLLTIIVASGIIGARWSRRSNSSS
ncbi:MAG: apolipoprotein N-acyltransferase, partial [Bosea sp. (in: a-proteobacteria)]